MSVGCRSLCALTLQQLLNQLHQRDHRSRALCQQDRESLALDRRQLTTWSTNDQHQQDRAESYRARLGHVRYAQLLGDTALPKFSASGFQ